MVAINQQLDAAMAEARGRIFADGTHAANEIDITLATAHYLGNKIDAGFDRMVDRLETINATLQAERGIQEKTRFQRAREATLHVSIPVGAVAIVADTVVRMLR